MLNDVRNASHLTERNFIIQQGNQRGTSSGERGEGSQVILQTLTQSITCVLRSLKEHEEKTHTLIHTIIFIFHLKPKCFQCKKKIFVKNSDIVKGNCTQKYQMYLEVFLITINDKKKKKDSQAGKKR